MTTERIRLSAAGRNLELEYCWLGREKDEAPVVVFLHEGLGSIAMWRSFPARLCDQLGLRGLVYSRFGYGGSTPRPAGERFPVDYLQREAVEVLPQLLAALGVVRPWLFGHSDGGTIALLAAAAFPGRFPGIVVLAPHILVEAKSIENIEVARTAYLEHGLRQRLARYHDDVDSAFYAWNDIWLHPAFRAWNIEDQLAAIACPVLAIQGEGDEYATLVHLHGIKRHVPQTRLLILADCGHSPHRDQPAAVIAGTAAFLADCGLPLARG